MSQAKPSAYFPALDGVRGLAVLAVMLFHFNSIESPVGLLQKLMYKVFSEGYIGVDLFLVLSGFLITGILRSTREGANYFRNFYIRRSLRIFPLYYAVLAIVVTLPFFWAAGRTPEVQRIIDHQAWGWLYGFNFLTAKLNDWNVTSFLGHFWSLAIEEQFYLVWPLLVFLCSRRQILAVSALVIAFSLGTRLGLRLSGADTALLLATPCRLDSLALGAVLSILVRDEKGLFRSTDFIRRLYRGLFLSGASLYLGTFLLKKILPMEQAFSFTLMECGQTLAFSSLILFAVKGEAKSWGQKFLRSAPMKVLGTYSYGLYVFNYIISWHMKHRGFFPFAQAHIGHETLTAICGILFGLALSMAFAYLSYQLFEKPFLQLKDLLTLSTARRAPAQAILPRDSAVPDAGNPR